MEGPGEGQRLGRGCQPGGPSGRARVECDRWKTGWRQRGHMTQALCAQRPALPRWSFPCSQSSVGLHGPLLAFEVYSTGKNLKVILLSLLSPLHPSTSSHKHLSNVSGNQTTGHIYTVGVSGLIHSRQQSRRGSCPFRGDRPPVS